MVQRSRTMMLPWKVLFSSIFLLSSSVVFQGHHFFVLSLSAPGSMSLEEIATQLSESSFCNVVVLVGAGLSVSAGKNENVWDGALPLFSSWYLWVRNIHTNTDWHSFFLLLFSASHPLLFSFSQAYQTLGLQEVCTVSLNATIYHIQRLSLSWITFARTHNPSLISPRRFGPASLTDQSRLLDTRFFDCYKTKDAWGEYILRTSMV